MGVILSRTFENITDAKIALLREALIKRPNSPVLLLQLAEAFAENGAARQAAEAFRRAYVSRPFVWSGRPGSDPGSLRDQAAAMIAHGAVFSATISALAIGEGRLGHANEVARLMDHDRFFRDTILQPPAGLALADFNASAGSGDKITSDLLSEGHGNSKCVAG